MEKIKRDIKLTALQPCKTIETVYYSEIEIELTIVEGTLLSGTTVSAYARGCNVGTVYTTPATISGNKITISPVGGFFVPGDNDLQIELVSGGKTYISFLIPVWCDDSLGGTGEEPETAKSWADKAKGYAESAEEAASKYPRISTTTGNWEIWDVSQKKYVDSGKPSTCEVDTTLSQSGKAADAKATGDALSVKTEKVRVDFDLTEKRFLKENTVLTFGQVNTMLQNTPTFVVFVHGKREHRCTLIDMDSNPKQMRFVAPVLSDGVLKTQSIYVTSNDGVAVTDMVMSNINCENVSNKTTSISDAATDTQYPSAKAVKQYVDKYGLSVVNGELCVTYKK